MWIFSWFSWENDLHKSWMTIEMCWNQSCDLGISHFQRKRWLFDTYLEVPEKGDFWDVHQTSQNDKINMIVKWFCLISWGIPDPVRSTIIFPVKWRFKEWFFLHIWTAPSMGWCQAQHFLGAARPARPLVSWEKPTKAPWKNTAELVQDGAPKTDFSCLISG